MCEICYNQDREIENIKKCNKKQNNIMRSIPLLIFITIIAFIFGLFFAISQASAAPYADNRITPDWYAAFDSTTGGDGLYFVASTTAYVNNLTMGMCRTFDYTSGATIWANIAEYDTLGDTYVIVATSTGYLLTDLNYYVNGAACIAALDEQSFEFATPYQLTATEDYAIIINTSTTTNEQLIFAEDKNDATYDLVQQCTGGGCTFNDTKNPYFYLSYDPVWDNDIQYYDLADDCPDVLSYHQICFINETCRMWVQYNDLTTASDLYLVPSATPWPEYAVDQVVAETNLEYAMPFEFAYSGQATGTIEEYCIYTDLPGTDTWDCLYSQNEWVECGYEITWVDRDEYEANWNTRMDELFDAYATTTEDMGRCDNVCTEQENFFACGFHKGICYAFVPSVKTMAEFEVNVEAAKGEFPINAIIEIQTILDNGASSTIDGYQLPNPMNILNEHFGEATSTLDVSSSTIVVFTGTELYEDLYSMAEYIIYFFGTIVLIYILFNDLFAKDEEQI